MPASRRTIQLQVIGSKEVTELEVDSSATVAAIKQQLAAEFGLDPKVKLLKKQQASLATLLDNEKPPRTGRIIVQGVSELKRKAATEVAAPKPPQPQAKAEPPSTAALSSHKLWMMAMVGDEEEEADSAETVQQETQAAVQKDAAERAAEQRRMIEEALAAAQRQKQLEETLAAERRRAEEEARRHEEMRRAREEAARREEEARKAKEEAERLAKEEARRRAEEEAEERARQQAAEAERRAREEAARQAEEAERLAREEAERQAEAQRKRHEDEEAEVRRAVEDADAKVRQEHAARRGQEMADLQAKEAEDLRKALEEAERLVKEQQAIERAEQEAAWQKRDEEELQWVRGAAEWMVREQQKQVREAEEQAKMAEEASRAAEEVRKMEEARWFEDARLTEQEKVAAEEAQAAEERAAFEEAWPPMEEEEAGGEDAAGEEGGADAGGADVGGAEADMEAEIQLMEERKAREEAEGHGEEASGSSVQVTIKHAVKGGEVKVSVSKDATFGDVKRALTDLMGRPELNEGKLVRPVRAGGQYSSYYDAELLGSKRRLLYMGPPILLSNPQEAAASRPQKSKLSIAQVNKKIPVDADGNPMLTAEQALDMQYELWKGFTDTDFQAKFQELLKKHNKDSNVFRRERQLLLLSVQQAVIPHYGFEPNLMGVVNMVKVFDQFNHIKQFSVRGDILNRLLGLEVPATTHQQRDEDGEPTSPMSPESFEHIPFDMDLQSGFTRLVRLHLRGSGESFWVPLTEDATLRQLRWILTRTPYSGQQKDLEATPFLDLSRPGHPELRSDERVPRQLAITSPGWPCVPDSTSSPETFIPLHQINEVNEKVIELTKSEEFFDKMQAIRDDADFQTKSMRLLTEVFCDVLPIIGLERAAGLEKYKASTRLHHFWHDSVTSSVGRWREAVGDVYSRLGMDPNDAPVGLDEVVNSSAGMLGIEEGGSSGDNVEVRLKHKTDGTELHIMVPVGSTMRDVRAIAAGKLRNPAVLQDGRVVKNIKNYLQVYNDDEPLGSKRRLLFIGAPLVPQKGMEDSPEQREAAVQPDTNTQKETPKEEEFVEVLLKLRDAPDQQITVMVSKSSTVLDVKEALAKKLKKPKIVKTMKLARKVGAGVAAFRDAEQLGGKRQFFVLGVDSLKEAKGSRLPELSATQAISLQYELLEGFSEVEFQSALKALLAEHGSDSPEFRRQRAKLLLTVQSHVLPKYGFEGTFYGAIEMVQVITKWSGENDEVARIGNEINRLLGFAETPPVFPEQEAATPAPAEEVSVEVKHAVTPGEAQVIVPTTATMRDVKLALATKFNNVEYYKKGRIVRNQGRAFTALADDTVLGKRRSLLFMGPALPDEASAPALSTMLVSEENAEEELAPPAPGPDSEHFHPPAGAPQPEAALEEGEVEVTIKPALEDKEGQVTLRAKTTMNILEVKQLLAVKLGRPEVSKTARIVRKRKNASEGMLVSVKDSEVLGDKWRKRTLLALNCDLPPREKKPPPSLDQAEKAYFHVLPAQLAAAQDAFRYGTGSWERKDITVTEIKRRLEEAHQEYGRRVPPPDEFACAVDLRGDGQVVPLQNTDMPALMVGGMRVQVQLLGLSEEEVSTWLNQAAGRQPATSSTRPALKKDRMINVGLQYSTEQVYVTMKDDSTVLDLKRRLTEEYGVPPRVEVLARAKDGFFITQQDAARPKRVVVLQGVATLNQPAKFMEDDMIKVMEEFNKKYAKAEFQKTVGSWREGKTSVEIFRKAVKEVEREVLPKFGFEGTKEGLAEWSATSRAFLRFPAFSEIWRKGQILLGTLGDSDATSMYRRSLDPPKGAVPNRDTTSQHGALTVREIGGYAALVREKKAADEAIDIMYTRIYEENREELWEGGNVKGHKMPSRPVVRRKYLEMPGTTVLHCRPSDSEPAVGGAVVFEVKVDGLDLSRMPQIGEGENFIFNTEGATVDESDDEENREADKDSLSHITVGYIDALSATPGSRAGTALLEHLYTMATSEGWDLLVLHSIRVEKTLKFWEKQGFHHYGAGKEATFRLNCLQNFGFAVPIASLERMLPPRPGCLFYAKFLGPD